MLDIGVSNFGIAHLEKLLETARVAPAVNQIELHPFLQRTELVAYCQAKGIVVEASTRIFGPAPLLLSCGALSLGWWVTTKEPSSVSNPRGGLPGVFTAYKGTDDKRSGDHFCGQGARRYECPGAFCDHHRTCNPSLRGERLIRRTLSLHLPYMT